MNMYDDYSKYITENEEVINNLKNTESGVMFILQDVLEVLDYIYNKYKDNVKIDNDLEEIFEIGYGYISNSLTDIKTYYEDYFKKDIILFNKYASLIMYSIMLDDLKGYLEGEEYLTDERKELLDDAGKDIDDVMLNLKEITPNLISSVEDAIEASLPKSCNYKPVYSVFELIREELGIY